MKSYIYLSLIALLLFGTFGCSEDEINNVTPFEAPSGFYVLCEGLYENNVSTLGFYNKKDSTFIKDYFGLKNKRKLGSLGNDMKRYGSKIWIVMSSSNRIEVINAATGVALPAIEMKAESGKPETKPRSITFHNGKAYVCCFNGTVSRIDTASLKIDATITVKGRNPDGICAANGKIYVSNSGGMDYPANYDHTVSVINTNTFTETNTLDVGLNPGKLMADKNGNVYVQIRGDYGETTAASFKKINSQTDAITKTWDLDVTNYTIDDATLYFYNYDYGTKKSIVQTINLNDESIANNDLIPENEISRVDCPYGIAVHKITKDVYITDAIDYKVDGDLFIFDSNGKYKSKLENVGIIPNSVVFMY